MSRRRRMMLGPDAFLPYPRPAAEEKPSERTPKKRRPVRKSLWFVVPARGRFDLSKVCLRQLARTCEEITGGGIDATAVVVADDANLRAADDLGFATVRRENQPLGRKWNDGYQLACDPALNPRPADFVVPLGTDDWVHPAFVLDLPLPKPNEIRCARLSSVVSEDATKLAKIRVPYEGGDGVRVIPRQMIEPFRYRPAVDDRKRAIDTSVLERMSSKGAYKLVYHDLHHLQIVDWKSSDEQLNSYRDCLAYQEGAAIDPTKALSGLYPREALNEMMGLHSAAAA